MLRLYPTKLTPYRNSVLLRQPWLVLTVRVLLCSNALLRRVRYRKRALAASDELRAQLHAVQEPPSGAAVSLAELLPKHEDAL